MKIHESDEWKTAFRIRYGYFKYQVMLFGLFNTQATFQKYVNKVLTKKLDIFVIVYLDKIMIYTEGLDQPYVKTVQQVLSQLRKYFLFANLKKCRFYEDEIRFLRYVVFLKKRSMKSEEIEAVKKWLKPKSIQDI